MKETKTQKGITLVALIITIIILLILAVVAIRSITGDGILQKAREASDATTRGQIQEELDLAISNLKMEEVIRKNMSQQEKAEWLRQELNKQDGNATVVESGNGFIGNYKDHNFSVSEDYKVTIGDYAQNGENNNSDNNQQGDISTTESYVGYYADIDANGTVDGIIYADLAIGGSGQWVDGNGTYTIRKKADFNNYYISQESYEESGFGLKPVISPIDTVEENDRFYVMALTDFNSETKYTWYHAAFGEMNDYNSTTSADFGTGKTNTQVMIEKWNNRVYGSQRDSDIWGQIQTQVSEGWFIPSRGEWAAFGNELYITRDNYINYSLQDVYWVSSQSEHSGAWFIHFNHGYISGNSVEWSNYVRLSTTF